MIQKNELKINNLIIIDNEKHRPTDNGKEAKIISIQEDAAGLQLLEDNYGINTFGQFYKYLKPIELTPEWAKKLGFNIVAGGISYDKEKLCLYFGDTILSNEKGRTYFNSWAILEYTPKYVHELQNLYFALYGVDLSVS